MPPKPKWRRHIAEIRAKVEVTEPPVFDRARVEAIFGLEPRQAQKLMKAIGGEKLSGARLLTRASLLDFLDGKQREIKASVPETDPSTDLEPIAGFLGELRRHRPPVVISAPPPPPQGALPEGAALEPGRRLVFCYTSADDLLVKIAGIVQAADENPGWFLELIEAEAE